MTAHPPDAVAVPSNAAAPHGHSAKEAGARSVYASAPPAAAANVIVRAAASTVPLPAPATAYAGGNVSTMAIGSVSSATASVTATVPPGMTRAGSIARVTVNGGTLG